MIGIGGALMLLTLIAWYLLSGFGCEMNTAGCRTVRLDMSRDALRLFLPPLAIGLVLVVIGLRRKPSRRNPDA
ncbi:hypothetical protein [Bosea sp. (in: a-proteobacteria)]|uniref:hypothetical protein n=1 Tax=Bosea sp. (in: a-proteobacteria) TaxID=1871050 RepID=UPI002732A9D7|nr:hypothetical protein [Bosea sp. (in: a-proteobacteria)]MDP3407626.1 hypothetical protein [Bosea sp. (in: a-proteobacteria)]